MKSDIYARKFAAEREFAADTLEALLDQETATPPRANTGLELDAADAKPLVADGLIKLLRRGGVYRLTCKGRAWAAAMS